MIDLGGHCGGPRDQPVARRTEKHGVGQTGQFVNVGLDRGDFLATGLLVDDVRDLDQDDIGRVKHEARTEELARFL